MGVIVKQSFWNSIWSYLGIVLGYINLVILFPKFLSTDEFGLTRIFIAAGAIIGQFGCLGIVNISVKYFPYFKNEKDIRHNGFVFFTLLISTVGALLTVLTLIVFKDFIIQAYIDKSKLFVDYFYWVIPLGIALIYYHHIGAYARAILKSSIQVFTRDFLIRVLHLLMVILYSLGIIDFDTFIAGFILSYFLIGIIIFSYLLIIKAVKYSSNFNFYQSLPVREIIVFGLFAIMSNLGGFVAGNIDILMLGSLAAEGLTDVAIYSVAFYIGNVVSVPTKAVNSIALPIIADAWKNNDLNKIQSIYTKSSINQLIIGCLLMLGLWANIENMFSILPYEYSSGKWVVLTIALSQLFNIASGVNGGIIINSPYFKYDTIFIFFMIVANIILNIILIKLMGFYGAALATAITLVLFNIGRLIVVYAKSKMQPFNIKTFYILIISIGIYLAQMLMPKIEITLLDLFVRSVLIVLLFIPTIYFLNISEDINHLIRKSLKTGFKLIGIK